MGMSDAGRVGLGSSDAGMWPGNSGGVRLDPRDADMAVVCNPGGVRLDPDGAGMDVARGVKLNPGDEGNCAAGAAGVRLNHGGWSKGMGCDERAGLELGSRGSGSGCRASWAVGRPAGTDAESASRPHRQAAFSMGGVVTPGY
jgi:hypothetical protein